MMEGIAYATSIMLHFLPRYGVKHKIAAPYDPLTNGQVKLQKKRSKRMNGCQNIKSLI